MTDDTTLMERLDGAKLVKYDNQDRVVHAWYGGHGVNVYDPSGNEVHFYNVGSFEDDAADRQEVKASMKAHINRDRD